jgi:hypothetical protein
MPNNFISKKKSSHLENKINDSATLHLTSDKSRSSPYKDLSHQVGKPNNALINISVSEVRMDSVAPYAIDEGRESDVYSESFLD